MQLVGSTCGPADDFPRACISIYPHARATCSHLYSSLRHARTPPSSTDVTLVCVCCGMTVGVMVGGHGREWAACVAPTTAHSESCTPATGVTQPAITPVVHITAGEDLPRAVSTRACPARDLCLSLTQEKFRQRRRAHEPTLGLQVTDGSLVARDNVQLSTWLPLLPLATDVHAEAATLSFVHSGQGEAATLRATLTRAVKVGETPPLWFSSEVAAQLGLPFLNFSHIKVISNLQLSSPHTEGRYVCPECERQFSAPNPLKLHLAANCDTLEPHLLWNRLLSSPPRPAPAPWFTPLLASPPLAMSALTSRAHPMAVSAKLLPRPSSPGASTGPGSPGGHKPVSPDSTSCHMGSPRSASPPRSPPAAPLPQEPRSAFRRVSFPVNRLECQPPRFRALCRPPSLLPAGPSRCSARSPAAGPLALAPPSPAITQDLLLHPRLLMTPMIPARTEAASTTQPMMPTMPLAGSTRPLLSAAPPGSAVDPCAEMETLVSNLGRSRRGHLCLYCGKVYSRKYGLKIHIRTHTGYKPLKCKVCLRPFGDPSNLNKHVRLHAEGETPYRCDHCGKVLVRRRDLDRHVRSRHPEVPSPPVHALSDTEDDDTDDADAAEDHGTAIEEEAQMAALTQKEPNSDTR
ncbi:sal-like protein 3 [Penaeus japonicus]|uniref:sal-like protein 3 n=1 Tax=Penaeus japonicus TaxID=27405 RepID=UPI001C716528|nr:sal-like protein 3 [Penaeus japonicus]